MTLWDALPDSLRMTGALDVLRPLLEQIEIPTSTEQVEDGRTWRLYRTAAVGQALTVDPVTGAFGQGVSSGTTPLELPASPLGVEVGLRLGAPGGEPDGMVRLTVDTPSAAVHLPFLRGALLDDQGQLRDDPAHPEVRFGLPALRIRVLRPVDGPITVRLLPAADGIQAAVRMAPPYALIGPGNAVGFAFRGAVLDLSGMAGPGGVPPEARTMPGDWQGLYLPDVRLFVAPAGLEGLAVSAGVRDLWIGLGHHAGLTGSFEAEVVNQSPPTVRLQFQTEGGDWIGVPDVNEADPDPLVNLPERSWLSVEPGGGLAPFRIETTVGDLRKAGSRVDVTTPDAGSVRVAVRVTDHGGRTATRSLRVQRWSQAGPGPEPGRMPAVIRQTSTSGSRIIIDRQSGDEVLVRLDPPGGMVTWSWTGGASEGRTAAISLEVGASLTIRARRAYTAESPPFIDAYTLFARPTLSDAGTHAYADNPANTSAQPASSGMGWRRSPALISPDLDAHLATFPPGTTWSVEGWASYEGDDSVGQRRYDEALSARRRDVLIRILEARGFAGRVSAGAAHGHGPARDGDGAGRGTAAPPASSAWWRARATATLPAEVTETVTAELTRPAGAPPAGPLGPTPERPPVPSCFRRIGIRVELVRSTVLRAELYGEFDVQTAVEQQLAAAGAGLAGPDPTGSDGICTFLVHLRIAEDRASWDVRAEFHAADGDPDGLARIDGPGPGVNLLGTVALLAPLLATATPPSPTAGELVPLALLSTAVARIGQSGRLTIHWMILRGGELVVTDGLVDPADGSGPRGTQASVMLDVETAFSFDLGFIRVRPDFPVAVRHRAVGLRSTWESRPREDGTVAYLPLPVFDPSRAYTLDVPAGALVVAPPLDDVLRILGVRVSRDNPTYLEVEVGLGVDLGVVQVDTARVRLRLDEVEPPQLTSLAATIDVPGTLHGAGQVDLTPDGFKGTFDLTVVPLNLRGAATLTVETREGVTGVLIGLEMKFPVPLPLGTSGLGLVGVLGGVGVNYRRREAGVPVPALRWMEGQLAQTPPGVMHPAGWEHAAGTYAIVAGVLLGTSDGGFVLHLKGLVLIEVPGPRLLLVLKADVLKLPPVLKSSSSATFLAVLDLDFAQGTITLGLVAEYTVVSLLHIRVPVTAFFSTRHTEQWFVDLGTFTEPVKVTLLDVFSGTGYLMVHGDGLVHPRLPPVSSGLTVAVGFHMQAMLMGNRAANLYLDAAADFDALVAFEPFMIEGRIHVRGELRLWVVSIAASAELSVLVGRQRLEGGQEVERTYVHGVVCGTVKFFFFKVRGCVSLTLGEGRPSVPEPPPLVSAVRLVSRSPALIEGTATDRAIDGVLADAVQSGSLPVVPLDVIPVILFDCVTGVADGSVVLGGVAHGASGLPANPWIRRGDRWWRYRVTGVELIGPLQPTSPPAQTPATWWTRSLPDGQPSAPALALLSWLPTPAPRAVPYGERLEHMLEARWSSVCSKVAPHVPVFWTFDGQPRGTSTPGWHLTGIPWPDDPHTYRSSAPDRQLTVTEPWRTGNEETDLLQGVAPARVVGDRVRCATPTTEPITGLTAWQEDPPLTFSPAELPLSGAGVQVVADLLADGIPLADIAGRWAAGNADRVDGPDPLHCQGRLLRFPTGGEAPTAEQAWTGAVRLSFTSSIRRFCALLLAHSRSVGEGLELMFLDASGRPIDRRRRVSGADRVSATHPLPPAWTAPQGPWSEPLERAGRLAARLAATEPDLVLVLVDVTPPGQTVHAEFGFDPRTIYSRYDAFWLLAVEGLSEDEERRRMWDASTLEREQSALQTALTQDPDDHALLVPGESYTVRVHWNAAVVKQDARPSATAPVRESESQIQDFRFTADPTPPAELGPWLLCNAPSMNETGVLCREPIRIALATQKVVALFDAYGEELRVVVRAASGRHPAPPGGAPGSPITLPVSLDGVVRAAPPTLSVPTPWQEAAAKTAGALPCVDASASRTHHAVIELPYELEPLTDYLLDVLAVPKGTPPDGAGRRIHRVGFTTSRFGTVDEFADFIALGVVEHRLLPTPGPLRELPDRPSGDQFDAAYQRCGLGVPQVPSSPRVQVLWSPDPLPQPVAVVLDCSETLWRHRPVPTRVAGPEDAGTPGHTWWAARDQVWLSVQASVTPDTPGDPPAAQVLRIVPAPGEARAVALLGPDARGREVRLDLVRAADPLSGLEERRIEAVRVMLGRAPWEEGL